MTKTSTTKKVISVYVAVSLLTNSIFPTYTKAITGPSAPEFSSFEPVSSNGMVNESSGDFSYNLPILSIPGADGGGYALSLSYKNTSPDEDASWVGYGWTLSPGAIIRSKNGFPDDVNGGSMTSFNDIPKNWTIGLGINAGVTLEGFSLEASIGELLLLQYNSNMGFSYSAIPNIGVGLGYGVLSLNLALQDGEGSFSAEINPAKAMSFFKKNLEVSSKDNEGNIISKPAVTHIEKQKARFSDASARSNPGLNAFFSYATDNTSRNTSISKFTGQSFKVQVGVQGAPAPVPIAVGTNLFGTYSFQNAEIEKTNNCYGYLYSANAAADDEALMDYYTEKDQGFNKRDYYLSIPYARPDQFLFMGEGMGGGFRAFSKKVGHFKTNAVESTTELFQVGIDIIAGLDIGLGGSGQTGAHSITVGDWDDEGENDDYNFSSSGDEAFYMSFMMDPAQYMSFGGDATDLLAQDFSIEETNGTIGMESYIPKHPTSLKSSVDADGGYNNRVPRSSQIIYHTNSEMAEVDNGGNYYKRYSNINADYETYLNRGNKGNQIGEFVFYNTTGARYVYGLPVYSQKESNLAYDISSPSTNYLVQENIANFDRKVGDSVAGAYATSWLLTSIVSPNYIDRKMDGPTDDDFGGWTKFNYSKKYGYNNDAGDNKWFKWRVPYNGLYNIPGSLSDDSDDMGSFSSGEKEMYYVESIETKTHIATFYKSKRSDGLDAADDETAANSFTAQGGNSVDRLDSIYLYAKDDLGAEGEVIKRIYFSYDYSLMQGAPNAGGVAGSDGVLTLKKVWFEYGNVRNAQISPYEFSYEYPANNTYPSPYGSLDNYGAFSDAEENPDYNKSNIDRWGSYQKNGASRLNDLNPWVDQTPLASFDPAAWQLKSIKLPTGGQIDVQYEADDYLYVQDRRAMVMASISSIDDGGDENGDGAEGTMGDKFYLNLAELDITSDADKAELVTLIQKQFIDGEAGKDPQKIYFRFLYSLLEGVAGLDSCGSDYITGYVDVAEVGSDATGVYLKIGSSSSGSEFLDDDETYSIPRQVCIDFYDKTRIGNINSADAACNLESVTEGNDAESSVYNLLAMVGDDILVENHSDLCLDIDEANSYLRVPVLKSKKGGGLRVKRILMFDEGLEANDATLNGKEYVYQNTDGLTSGVASNEPSRGSEENALITYLDVRKDSDFLQKVISGEDLEQYEGPIGTGILPGPSVTYSRVVAKNIHTDENTNDGFSTSEFYTTYDYPFDGHYSYTDASGNEVGFDAVEYTQMNQEEDFLPLYTIVYNKVVSNIWSSQGYRFVVNDMNGKPKKNAVYSGNYDHINLPDSVMQTSGVEYTYYEPLEPVSVVDRWEWKDEAAMVPEYRVLGKQMDVVTESRSIKDQLNDATLELDGSIGIFGIIVIPFASGMLYVNDTENELYTHVTNKVIYASTPLKSIRKYQDGIYVDTYNEFFDDNTGEAMVNITNDGFNNLTLGGAEHDGRYVNYSFPSAHYYDGTAVRSITDGYRHENSGCFFKEYESGITTLLYNVDSCGSTCAMDVFTEGDLVALTNIDGLTEVYNIGEIIGNSATLLPHGDFFYDNIDGYKMADVVIVNTARKNQLVSKVGGLTTYGGYPDVTDVPIDQAILDARGLVADALNDALPTYGTDGTMEAILNFPDVSVIDSLGNCVPLNSTSSTLNSSTETDYYVDYDTIITWYPEECIFPFNYPNPLQWVATNDSVNYHWLCVLESVGSDNDCNSNPSITLHFAAGDIYVPCTCANCFQADTTYAGHDIPYDIPVLELVFEGCTISFTYVEGYEFYIDPANGELMYGDSANPCDAVLVECFDFCPNEFAAVELDKVVASSAVSLSDEWGLTSDLKKVYSIPGTDLNEYEYGTKGHWLGKYTYDYNTSLSDMATAGARVWNSGIYGDFTVFNWDYEEANDSVWTLLNTTTRVSPNAIPLAEMNALNIYSSMKMGYDFSVPYLTANNSVYQNVMFEGFETAVNTGTKLKCEDGYEISTTTGFVSNYVKDTAHTGNLSIRMEFEDTIAMGIKTFESELTLQKITLNNQVINKGVSVKLWVKSDKSLSEFSLIYSKYDEILTALVDTSVSFNKIAQTGEWTLYEAQITGIDSKTADQVNTITPTVYMKLSGPSMLVTEPKLYIDDIRMQPRDAQMTAYVYDPETLRLLASFDDQHFALLYQYNEEGKLVRKMKETAEGIKTISETQYNMPKSARP